MQIMPDSVPDLYCGLYLTRIGKNPDYFEEEKNKLLKFQIKHSLWTKKV